MKLTTGTSSSDWNVFADPQRASVAVAAELDQAIRSAQETGKGFVLGLATGSTPRFFYEELVRRHREEGLSFEGVETFNLDEYLGIDVENKKSYHAEMRAQLFDLVGLPSERTHLPPSRPQDPQQAAQEYEELMASRGGVDWQLLGVGGNGHIGFNEPGSQRDTRTRLVELDGRTRQDAAEGFGGLEKVPTQALSMGVGTILEARRIVLMGWGPQKAEVLKRAFAGEPTAELPVSWLKDHPNFSVVTDHA